MLYRPANRLISSWKGSMKHLPFFSIYLLLIVFSWWLSCLFFFFFFTFKFRKEKNGERTFCTVTKHSSGHDALRLRFPLSDPLHVPRWRPPSLCCVTAAWSAVCRVRGGGAQYLRSECGVERTQGHCRGQPREARRSGCLSVMSCAFPRLPKHMVFSIRFPPISHTSVPGTVLDLGIQQWAPQKEGPLTRSFGLLVRQTIHEFNKSDI